MSGSRPIWLSKTQVLAARQCRKRLWLTVNRPQLRSVTVDAQRRLDRGNRLNDLHQRVIPGGHLIPAGIALDEALSETHRHLTGSSSQPLFEGTFSASGARVRADAFERAGAGWRLTELKSSTRVKIHHLADCAVQTWVIREAGYPVSEVVLSHVNTGFLYRGDADYAGLFKRVYVTAAVEPLLPDVPGWIAAGLETLAGDQPDIDVGAHCTSPFACPFLAHCRPRPAAHPLTLLHGGGRVINQLLDEGIRDISDIPPGRLTRPLHERIRQATVSGKPFVARDLAEILQSLPYPRFYLDFESIQFMIPVWAGTRPYEQLPFQWSCHIEASDGATAHAEFLDISGEPPMRGCAEALIETVGQTGPILTYSPFERRVMRDLARRFPDLKPALDSAAERVMDLLPIVRTHYYHPGMRGSFSIKAVLPTVVPTLSYKALGDVNDGSAAQAAFEEAIDEETPESRRKELADGLLRYCALDTLAMLELVRLLSKKDLFAYPGNHAE